MEAIVKVVFILHTYIHTYSTSEWKQLGFAELCWSQFEVHENFVPFATELLNELMLMLSTLMLNMHPVGRSHCNYGKIIIRLKETIENTSHVQSV